MILESSGGIHIPFIRVHRRIDVFALPMAALLLAAGCSTPPKGPPAPEPSAFGKYYKDDGPPLAVPHDLAQVPDAVPRDEPFHRFANRPYTVFGQGYVPVVDKQPMRQRGMASWYGRRFHGQKTASGEPYDMFKMTAAHKTLPIPSYVRVTNVKNGLSVVVRVNDRGPFHAGRIIDLSYAAAVRIGIAQAGSGLVEVPPATGTFRLATAPAPLETADPGTPPPDAASPAREEAGLWLQVGAFSSADGAENFRARIAGEMPWLLEPITVSLRDGLHRVRLGPYRNNEEAVAIGDKVRRSVGIAPVLSTR
jgi:rare lipoprotein A